MKQLGIWDPSAVKVQSYKTAIEVNDDDQEELISNIIISFYIMRCFSFLIEAIFTFQSAVMLLRIDDIVSGLKKPKDEKKQPEAKPDEVEEKQRERDGPSMPAMPQD